MNRELLKVEGLKVHFPIRAGIFRRTVGQLKAVDGVDFQIAEGETLGLVGESGSGKSTIARAALRLIEPTAGSIIFSGREILTLKGKEMRNLRSNMQIIFQDPLASLNPRKTIGEIIGEPLRYHKEVTTLNEQYERVAALLKMVGLNPDNMNRYPHQLSGGQQQRICIGRAIALNPQFIICDEAVSALDVSVQAQILNLLQELQQVLKLSYLFISHDLSVIRYLSDRVIVLYRGKIVESASTKTLFGQPHHPYTRILLSAIPPSHPRQRRKLPAPPAELDAPLAPPSGCPFRKRCPFAVKSCSETPPRQSFPDPNAPEREQYYYCIFNPIELARKRWPL